MKKIFYLLIGISLISVIACNKTFEVSETFDINVNQGTIEQAFKQTEAAVKKIDKKKIIEKVCVKYPDATIKSYVEKIKISLVKQINYNLGYSKASTKLKLKISMPYDASRREEAAGVLKYYSGLVINELNTQTKNSAFPNCTVLSRFINFNKPVPYYNYQYFINKTQNILKENDSANLNKLYHKYPEAKQSIKKIVFDYESGLKKEIKTNKEYSKVSIKVTMMIDSTHTKRAKVIMDDYLYLTNIDFNSKKK